MNGRARGGSITLRMSKSQSAMEYLMTYGWAILIIAIVLGVLFQLGVFNSGNFASKASPGSCQVVKEGSGTTGTISLVGQCTNAEPQMVGYFSGSSAYISVPDGPLLDPTTFTLCAWITTTVLGGSNSRIVSKANTGGTHNDYDLFFTGGGLIGTRLTNTIASSSFVQTTAQQILGTNKFYFVCSQYDGSSSALIYVNGTVQATGSLSLHGPLASSTNPLLIGYTTAEAGTYWSGYISNVQLYNITLSSSEILALYQEGIGGPPIRPTSLIGWWPLNGNPNDYSGNNENGQPVGGVSYSSFWTSAYTPI